MPILFYEELLRNISSFSDIPEIALSGGNGSDRYGLYSRYLECLVINAKRDGRGSASKEDDS
jgi:hypothetical protein